jgi:hypothetical protein
MKLDISALLKTFNWKREITSEFTLQNKRNHNMLLIFERR